MGVYQGFILQPTRFDYLVRKAFPIGILDHEEMKCMENTTHGTVSLDSLQEDQAKRLKAAPFDLLCGPCAMTDLDTNLLVTRVTIPAIGYSTVLTLAPIKASKAYDPFVSSLLGKHLPGLETPIKVDPALVTLIKQL